MHIDFAPPSKGTYNNAGSSRQLASYMEHEDLERMEKEIYTDGFSIWRRIISTNQRLLRI